MSRHIKDTKHERVHKSFIKEAQEMQKERINKNFDRVNNPLTFGEITGILPTHNEWPKIRKDIINLDRKRFNRRGGLFSLIHMAVLLVVIAIVGLVVVVVSAVFIHGFSIITTEFQNAPSDSVNNISNIAGNIVFGNITLGLRQLVWISYFLIFGMFLGVLIGMFSVREHPGFFGLYFIFTIVSIIFGIFIARAYETLYESSGVLGAQLQTFVGASWLLLYLPIWITVVAFVGTILMFVVFNTDPEQGSLR